MRNIQKYTAALLSTVMILSLLLTSCSGRKDDGTVTITNVSYDPTREFYEKYNKIFESYYESEHGKKINVIQSHGGSGAQARSVVEGCNADVVTLALEHDIDLIQNTGLIDKGWIDEFDIDGLRLDVAYCLDHDFIRRLRAHCDGLKQDFFLLGELLHGDYNVFVNDGMLHSATNYMCYKGLYSSFNCMNMFEIIHSLLQQFGPEEWTRYKGKHFLSFVDNHDVTRVASILTNKNHLPLIYALAFGMPGIPCVYYGSEWGAEGRKEEGDPSLRLSYEKPEWNELTDWISKLAEAKKHSEALNYGGFRSVVLTNHQCIFERRSEHERVLVAINASDQPYTAHFDAGCGTAQDLITGQPHDFGGGSELPPYSAAFWKMEH